jgi:hypothetical protein
MIESIRKERLIYGFMLLSFALSRLIFYLSGVRFYTFFIDLFVQHAETYLLKNKLLESVFYMHSQPPLFNLILGIFLKIFNKLHFEVKKGIYN